MKIIPIHVLSVFLLTGCVTSGMHELKKMPIEVLNLRETANGYYYGQFVFKRWFYFLGVRIEEKKVTGIDISDCAYIEDKKIQEINRGLIETTISRQSLDFDAISGASLHTKVFKKAVENALATEKGNSFE